MAGRATFTTVPSTTIMSWAVQTNSSANQRRSSGGRRFEWALGSITFPSFILAPPFSLSAVSVTCVVVCDGVVAVFNLWVEVGWSPRPIEGHSSLGNRELEVWSGMVTIRGAGCRSRPYRALSGPRRQPCRTCQIHPLMDAAVLLRLRF
jgi:hypothetical protein